MLLEITNNNYINVANLTTYHPHSGMLKFISQKSISLSPEDNAEYMQNFLSLKGHLPGFIFGPRIVFNLAFVEQIYTGTDKQDNATVTVCFTNKTYYDLTDEDAQVVLKLLAKEQPRILSPHN